MVPSATVQIGKSAVGDAQPVYVIAEAGVNHNGDVDTALRLIDAAVAAGADAVKFQIFSAARLAGPDAPPCEYQRAHGAPTSQFEMLKELELSPDDFQKLAAHANDAGIAFLATPFSTDDLSRLRDLKPPAIKIASPDLINFPLLDAAAQTRLPLIVSAGAATTPEIDRAVERIAANGAAGRLILMHCVSSYPTRPAEARLNRIAFLRQRHNVPVGFSDHTLREGVGAWAAAAGASILEKHFTLDRSAKGPDHFFSLEPPALARYIAAAKEAAASLGRGNGDFAESDSDVRRLSRVSIVADRAIPSGATLTADALSFRRPGEGIGPDRLDEVIGRRTNSDIPADTPLAWSMLE